MNTDVRSNTRETPIARIYDSMQTDCFFGFAQRKEEFGRCQIPFYSAISVMKYDPTFGVMLSETI